MTSTVAEVIDAVASDLDGLDPALPAHTTWKYADPPVIRPDLGRMLAVFPKETDYTLLATNSSYEIEDVLSIVWYVPLIASPETGGAADPGVAQAALADALKIEARLRTYGVAIPGVTDENEATLTKARYGLIVGATTWAAEYTLKVTRWPV